MRSVVLQNGPAERDFCPRLAGSISQRENSRLPAFDGDRWIAAKRRAVAGAVRDLGHEVIGLSEPGPLVERLNAMGLEHLEIPLHRRRPSPGVARRLVRLVRERRVDVVHGYEWPPVIEILFGPGLRLRAPVVGTVMSMSVAPFFPRTVPLLVGTEQIPRCCAGFWTTPGHSAGAAGRHRSRQPFVGWREFSRAARHSV